MNLLYVYIYIYLHIYVCILITWKEFWLAESFSRVHKWLNIMCVVICVQFFLSIPFLEITMRFESTTEMAGHLDSSPTMSRKILLEILIPWLYNIELVDCDVENEAQINMGLGRDDLAEDQDVGCPQRKTGWGSKQATQVVLNNLLSITQEVRL